MPNARSIEKNNQRQLPVSSTGISIRGPSQDHIQSRAETLQDKNQSKQHRIRNQQSQQKEFVLFQILKNKEFKPDNKLKTH